MLHAARATVWSAATAYLPLCLPSPHAPAPLLALAWNGRCATPRGGYRAAGPARGACCATSGSPWNVKPCRRSANTSTGSLPPRPSMCWSACARQGNAQAPSAWSRRSLEIPHNCARDADPLCCIEACMENRSIERESALYRLYSGLSLCRIQRIQRVQLYSVYTIQHIQCTTL